MTGLQFKLILLPREWALNFEEMFLLILLLKMILTWIKVSHIMFLLLDENSMGFLSTPQKTNWCDTNLHFTMLCDISDTSPYCRITYINLPDVSFTYLLIGKINNYTTEPGSHFFRKVGWLGVGLLLSEGSLLMRGCYFKIYYSHEHKFLTLILVGVNTFGSLQYSQLKLFAN